MNRRSTQRTLCSDFGVDNLILVSMKNLDDDYGDEVAFRPYKNRLTVCSMKSDTTESHGLPKIETLFFANPAPQLGHPVSAGVAKVASSRRYISATLAPVTVPSNS